MGTLPHITPLPQTYGFLQIKSTTELRDDPQTGTRNPRATHPTAIVLRGPACGLQNPPSPLSLSLTHSLSALKTGKSEAKLGHTYTSYPKKHEFRRKMGSSKAETAIQQYNNTSAARRPPASAIPSPKKRLRIADPVPSPPNKTKTKK